MLAKPTSFFVTEKGRKLVFLAAGCTTVGIFLVNYVPHTFGIKYYRDFMQCYDTGSPRSVPKEVNKRVEIALDKLNVPEYERALIKPFSVFGFDLFHAGSTLYRFGAYLGIPANYSYSSAEDIETSEIFLGDKKTVLNTKSGQLLREALVLNENEQIFGICKSILQLRTHGILLNSLYPTVTFFLMYVAGNVLNTKYQFLTRPRPMRLILYSILGTFGFGMWSFMTDYNQVMYDITTDKVLSELGPEFVAAGISFYDKQLKKNMAIRDLVGDDTYTAKGNVSYWLRQKSLPLTMRKSFFEEKWKELKENTQPATENVQ